MAGGYLWQFYDDILIASLDPYLLHFIGAYNRDIHKLSPYFKFKRFVSANTNPDEAMTEKKLWTTLYVLIVDVS